MRRVKLLKLSLNKAVTYEKEEQLHAGGYLAHQRFPIYLQTLEAYNAFVHYLKEGKWTKKN